jgi:hypothetical protein
LSGIGRPQGQRRCSQLEVVPVSWATWSAHTQLQLSHLLKEFHVVGSSAKAKLRPSSFVTWYLLKPAEELSLETSSSSADGIFDKWPTFNPSLRVCVWATLAEKSQLTLDAFLGRFDKYRTMSVGRVQMMLIHRV